MGISQSEKFAKQSVGHTPNVSRDNVLTVFAQLASLRLNEKRALISLFDRTTQHVVAEATPELGLRRSEGGSKSNTLWLGVQRLPRERVPMCNQAMSLFTEVRGEIFLVSDLRQDSRFQSHASVTGAPYHRFYVSVPIRSPKPSFYVNGPSRIDPSAAPRGKDAVVVLVSIGHIVDGASNLQNWDALVNYARDIVLKMIVSRTGTFDLRNSILQRLKSSRNRLGISEAVLASLALD